VKLCAIILVVFVGAMALACEKDFSIRSVSPGVGTLSGGEQVEINGSGFDPQMGMSVYFGNRQADNVVISSTNKLIVMSPASSKEENVDIRVALDDGKEYLVKDGFRYIKKTNMDIRDLGKRQSKRKIR
jgi:hypothetical protein